MSADGTRLKSSFSIKLYIFKYGAGNSIAANRNRFIFAGATPHSNNTTSKY
jgi:hypothetical protein